jgi:hypothetical protein
MRHVTSSYHYDPPGSIESEGELYRRIEHAPWSPAQVVLLAAGMVVAVIGGVALARTHLHFSDIPATHAQAAGLRHTSLSAAIELGIGVILLGIGAVPGAARGLMTFAGVVLLGAGLVIAIQPSSFHKWFGYNAANGVYIAIIGGALLLAAMISPVVWGSRDRRRIERARDVTGSPSREISERS